MGKCDVELEALDLLHYSPVDGDGGVLGHPFPVVHDQLLCIADVEGEVVVLAPHCQVTDLLPICCLIVVGDQAYHCHVVSKLNDGVEVVHDQTVVGEQRVQEASVFMVSMADVLLPTLSTCGVMSGIPGSSCRWKCSLPGS
jgi:hypothetical protein